MSNQRKNPFIRFMQAESSSGIVLIICTIVAMLLANFSKTSEIFFNITRNVNIGEFLRNNMPHLNNFNLELFINDGLMAIFFFMVGLEIKRELMTGNLSTKKQAALPVFAAIGGMVVPAVIYTIFNNEGPESAGWGIPMATDIAFALGILAILGKRVPLALKVFLSAVAIADDLGAIIVIALFYTDHIVIPALIIGAVLFGILILLNVLDIRIKSLYLFLSVLLWMAILESGIHATIAGVLVALAIPAKPRISLNKFVKDSRKGLDKIEEIESTSKIPEEDLEILHQVEHIDKKYKDSVSPLKRIEHNITQSVAFIIIPLFALVNAGVLINGNIAEVLQHKVSIGIVLGLVLGKPIGIIFFTALAAVFKIGELPKNVKWGHVVGMSLLAGIGFTMSFFIDNLAFKDKVLIDTAKIGVMVASLLSAILGSIWLILFTKKNPV